MEGISNQRKVIIVTGASRGIGLAVCHYLLQRQHRVVVIARSEGPLLQLADQYPAQVAILAGDLSEFSLGPRAIELAQRYWQRLDGLVINHGVLGAVTRVADTSAEGWRDCFNVNFFSAVCLAAAAIPALRESHGRIILNSSGAAAGAVATWGAYGSSKAALNHLAKTLANEEASITTVSINPGTVDTEMQREIREEYDTVMDATDVDKFRALKQNGQLLEPEDPGNVLARLALNAPLKLSGRFMEWNTEDLQEFQQDG